MNTDASYPWSKEQLRFRYFLWSNGHMLQYDETSISVLRSTEANFVALIFGAWELYWLLNLMKETKSHAEPAAVYHGNQGALNVLEKEF